MNKSTKTSTLVLAASIAGVAIFSLANADFTAAFRGDVFLAITASIAVISFAVFDYSRSFRSLVQPGQVLRPALPTGSTLRPAAKSARKERAAA
jgi:hypothetical protein